MPGFEMRLRGIARFVVCATLLGSPALAPELAAAAPKAARLPEGAGALSLLLTRLDALGQVRWTVSARRNETIYAAKAAERDRLLADARAVREVMVTYDARVGTEYVEGMAWLAWADVAATLPLPRRMTASAESAWRDALWRDEVAPAAAAGRAALEATVTDGREAGAWDAWNVAALRALKARYPDDWPADLDETVAPPFPAAEGAGSPMEGGPEAGVDAGDLDAGDSDAGDSDAGEGPGPEEDADVSPDSGSSPGAVIPAEGDSGPSDSAEAAALGAAAGHPGTTTSGTATTSTTTGGTTTSGSATPTGEVAPPASAPAHRRHRR